MLLMLGIFIATGYNGGKLPISTNGSHIMTKPKKQLKAYRGTQSYLTAEQISMLDKNPNIIKVTPRQVHYTQTFKNYFCREYAKGRSSTEILREQGIDPKVLGETRVSSLRTYYNNVKNAFPGKEALSLEGKNPYRGTKGTGHTQLQTNADIIHMIGKLEQQVQYLEKETDFLKKIFAHDYLKETPHKSSQKNVNSPSLTS